MHLLFGPFQIHSGRLVHRLNHLLFCILIRQRIYRSYCGTDRRRSYNGTWLFKSHLDSLKDTTLNKPKRGPNRESYFCLFFRGIRHVQLFVRYAKSASCWYDHHRSEEISNRRNLVSASQFFKYPRHRQHEHLRLQKQFSNSRKQTKQTRIENKRDFSLSFSLSV